MKRLPILSQPTPNGPAAVWFFNRTVAYARHWYDESHRRAWVRGDPCVYCGDVADSVDHIQPQNMRGGHTIANLAAACVRCNASKHALPLLLFLIKRRDWTGWRRILRRPIQATAEGRDPHGRLLIEPPSISWGETEWEKYWRNVQPRQ